MKCPACGSENVRGTAQCASCGRPLGNVDVRLSYVAVASSILAIVAVISFIPGLIAELDPRVLHPQSGFAKFSGMLTFLAAGLAFLLGVASLFDIAVSGGRQTGYGFAVIGAATPAFVIVGLTYVPAFAGVKALSPEMTCGTNLAGIGKAMLIYANDHNDEFPLAGGRGTVWAPRLKDWAAASRSDAFGLRPDNTGGQATISSSLYVLVRYAELTPKTFVCKGDRGTRPFDPNRYNPHAMGLTGLWDFGPNPARHCSYSYQMPYSLRRLTTSNDPGMPVAADRNPWIDRPSRKAEDFSKFRWDGTAGQQQAGDVVAHWANGQNVLFLDSHVEFAKRAFCGLNDDNIYTYQDAGPVQQGKPPVAFESRPTNETDALLVNDPPMRKK